MRRRERVGLRVADDGAIKGLGDGGDGQVIVGGADASRAQDLVEARGEVANEGGDGVEVIADFVAVVLDDDAKARASFWIQDGSGLSASNLVTPAAVVRVLAHVLEQPWRDTLVDALARPGTGTLRTWPPVSSVAAKTGTLRHTVALAGFLNAGPGAPVVFCYFVNHHPELPGTARRQIASALGRWRALGSDH